MDTHLHLHQEVHALIPQPEAIYIFLRVDLDIFANIVAALPLLLLVGHVRIAPTANTCILKDTQVIIFVNTADINRLLLLEGLAQKVHLKGTNTCRDWKRYL